MFKLLYDQVSAVLNLVPLESTNGVDYSIMDPLEILGGHKLIDFLLDEPKVLQAELRLEINKIRDDRFASGLNLIQRIIGDDKERRHWLRKNGLLKKEMSCISIFV